MLRKYLVPVLVVVQVMVFLLLASVFMQRPAASAAGAAVPPDSPEAQIAANGSYFWSYAAKFVCGQQAPLAQGAPGEPVVKPGNYATDINIHNPSYRVVPLRKKFLLMVENGQAIAAEPQSVGPRPTTVTMALGADMATMDDCNTLWKYIYPAGIPGNRPLTAGYLVILSPTDLDVNVVYTAAAPGNVYSGTQSISIDVGQVTGKRIFVPAGVLP